MPPAVSAPAGTPSAPPLPSAVLWDMDGTLVDTEPHWMAAEHALVARHGGTWTHQDALALVGFDLLDAAAVLQEHGVDLPAQEIVELMLDEVIAGVRTSVHWQPGVRELLAALREAGIPCALVTMSYRRFADAVLSHAPEGTFAVVVTGDNVQQGKPHPEAYLRAAELLGVDAGDCVAIEDSPPGVAAALASGARTLGVQHIVPVEERPGLSRATTLVGIGLDELRRLRAGEVLELP
ncbi:HAD family hydrolase [Actinotalea sp.]|uniref:HAD family hydrolase n=1 Tax=Actinotalea sp. TaxID=1872145 RepID=UPI00356A3493